MTTTKPKPVPTKFWSQLFPAWTRATPIPTHQVKADAMRDPATGERWVDVSWMRWWHDPDGRVRHTFRSPEVVRLVNLGPSGCPWAALRDAMLAELGDHPFAELVREADRAAAG